jgi:hypothetical protein
MDPLTIVGVTGGIIGALACVFVAISSFRAGSNGKGVACLALTPVAYLVVSALAIFVVGLVILAFLIYIAIVAISMEI